MLSCTFSRSAVFTSWRSMLSGSYSFHIVIDVFRATIIFPGALNIAIFFVFCTLFKVDRYRILTFLERFTWPEWWPYLINTYINNNLKVVTNTYNNTYKIDNVDLQMLNLSECIKAAFFHKYLVFMYTISNSSFALN